LPNTHTRRTFGLSAAHRAIVSATLLSMPVMRGTVQFGPHSMVGRGFLRGNQTLARRVAVRIHLGELGTQQEYLSRVIHPNQENYQCASCPVRRFDSRLAEIYADQKLSDREQQRRDESPHPHVTPQDGRSRHVFVDEGKQGGGNTDCHHEVDRLQKNIGASNPSAPVFSESCNRS